MEISSCPDIIGYNSTDVKISFVLFLRRFSKISHVNSAGIFFLLIFAMRTSLRLLENFFVRYDGGYPVLIRSTGGAYSELLEDIKSKFFSTYSDLPIGQLQLFKPNDNIALQFIEEVNFSEYQTDKNPLTLKLKPFKIKIDDGTGCIKRHEVQSQDDFDTLIKDSSGGLMCKSGIEISDFMALKDGQTYRLLIPKIVSIVAKDMESKKGVTIKFVSQQDFNDYLNAKKLYALSELNDKRKSVTFESLRNGKTYLAHKVDETFIGWVQKEANAMEEEAILASKAEIVKLLKAQNLDSTLIDKRRKLRDIRDDSEVAQEWDGIFYAPATDTLYLIECKHCMQLKLIEAILGRFNNFMLEIGKLGLIDGKEFNASYKNIIGIVCATDFPKDLRRKGESAGLLTLVPSGKRYTPGNLWRLEAKTRKY
jgi:hypothetical protein